MPKMHDCPESKPAKSNREIGEVNVAKLRDYLDQVDRVPARGNEVNISAIAIAACIDRQVLYRPICRAMIAAVAGAKGLSVPDQQHNAATEVSAWAERRIFELEQQLAATRAEVHDLRSRVRRYEIMDRHMAETGMIPR